MRDTSFFAPDFKRDMEPEIAISENNNSRAMLSLSLMERQLKLNQMEADNQEVSGGSGLRVDLDLSAPDIQPPGPAAERDVNLEDLMRVSMVSNDRNSVTNQLLQEFSGDMEGQLQKPARYNIKHILQKSREIDLLNASEHDLKFVDFSPVQASVADPPACRSVDLGLECSNVNQNPF